MNPNLPRDNFDPNKNLLLDINAFRAPAPFTYGNAGSILPKSRTFRNLNEDFGLMKRTNFNEKVTLEFRFEMFNAFNRVNLVGPSAGQNSVQFMQTTQAYDPRILQLALRFQF